MIRERQRDPLRPRQPAVRFAKNNSVRKWVAWCARGEDDRPIVIRFTQRFKPLRCMKDGGVRMRIDEHAPARIPQRIELKNGHALVYCLYRRREAVFLGG